MWKHLNDNILIKLCAVVSTIIDKIKIKLMNPKQYDIILKLTNIHLHINLLVEYNFEPYKVDNTWMHNKYTYYNENDKYAICNQQYQ